MALAPVWASIWPIFTTSWAAAGATARASSARERTTRFIHASCTRWGSRCPGSPAERRGHSSEKRSPDQGGGSEGKPLGDDLFHDLRGPRGDGPEPDVAEEALHGELGHVAVASMELHRLVGDAVGHLGAEELGHRDLGDAVLARAVEPGGMVEELTRGFDLGGHVRDPVPQHLLLAEGPIEGAALPDIGDRILERLGGA